MAAAHQGHGVSRRTETPSDDRLMSVTELAEHLGVGVRFIRRLVSQRRIPYYKIGKYVKFDRQEVEDWKNSVRVDKADWS